MRTRNAHTLFIASLLMGSGLLLACVDNGHVLGDAAPAGSGGEAGSVGVANASGGNQPDAGHSGGRSASPDGGSAGSSEPKSGSGGSADGDGGTTVHGGGVSGGVDGSGGKTGGSGGSTAATGGRTGGSGGTTAGTGGTCGGGEGGNLSIPFGQAEQYACCATSDGCHVLYTNCSCAAVSTQVTELVDGMVCDRNSCLETGRDPPSAACQSGQCTLVLDTEGTGGSTTGGTGGTGGTCAGGEGGNLSIPWEQADQYACCATSDDCHVLWTNCSCAAVSTDVTELMSSVICGTNSCLVSGREPTAVCQNGKCTLVLDYACKGTLDEVPVWTDCPATYDATVAWLQSCEGVTGLPWSSGYSGACSGFLAAQVSWGTHGQTCYYNESSGELVGTEVTDDVLSYCDGSSSSMVGGEYPAQCPLGELTFRGACNCNDLENVGTDVTPVDTDAAIPTGDGGSFVFGTYVLSDVRTYAGSSVTGDLPVMRQTLVIMSGQGLFVSLEEGVTTQTAFEYVLDGTAATFTTTCTTDASSPEFPYSSFTADATAITLYSSSLGMSVTYTAYQE